MRPVEWLIASLTLAGLTAVEALAQAPERSSAEAEDSLARAFAPELIVDSRDCLWSATDGRLAGGYFYAVRPMNVAGDSVRLAYLPAYLRDCGWHGTQRLIRFGRSDAHAGDSELIMLDVARDDATGGWYTFGVFLSAHCFGKSGGRCRWFRGSELDDFDWISPRGAPRVWVARNKHANYPTRARCESGHWRQESCASRPVSYRFPVMRPEQKIGSRTGSRYGEAGCVSSEALPLPTPAAAAGARECLWSNDTRFRGWQRGVAGSATPYGLLLQRIGGF